MPGPEGAPNRPQIVNLPHKSSAAQTIHPNALAAAAHQNNGASNRMRIWCLPAGTGNPRNATLV